MDRAIVSDPLLDASAVQDGLARARERTLGLIDGIAEADLERVHSPLMSPLVWDLGHIAAYEDLWLVHRYGSQPLLRPELADLYDAFETPRAVRGDVRQLGLAGALAYLEAVRERALEVLVREGVGDGTLHEMVIRHEHQHNETMLQTLALARLDYYRPRGHRRAPAAAAEMSGLDLVDVAGGEVSLGAGEDSFAYDNERPGHRVRVADFRIGRTPVTNGDWLAWVSDGGYHDATPWCEAGWAWRQAEGVEHPGAWEPEAGDGGYVEWRVGAADGCCAPEALDRAKPVVHVSWYEADAFARAHGARLPSELEWETACCVDAGREAKQPRPWGADSDSAGRANLWEANCFGTTQVGALPAGSSPSGVLGTLGDVWEWTASDFTGYPGFVAHPYPEYSEVFFGRDYKVLRGGSWATSERVATPTFRNWDFPKRRQIFAGVRLAGDA